MNEMKTKVLEIDKVKIDNEVYPRVGIDWVTSARYYNALKSGAKFPPITVAKFGKEFLLIDGAHRLKAFKDFKLTKINAEVLEGLDKKQIYLEAVRRNISHGRQFSTQEVTQICINLEKWKLSKEQISEIVRIPADELSNFVIKRMTRITETNEQIPLKSVLQNMAGISMENEPNQHIFNSRNQVQILESLIVLLENDYIDLNSEIAVEKLIKLRDLINQLNI